MAARWFMRPESSSGKRSANLPGPTCSRSSPARVRSAAVGRRCTSIWIITFCRMVRHGSRRWCWNTMRSAVTGRPTGRPITLMVPSDAGTRPAIMLSSVLCRSRLGRRWRRARLWPYRASPGAGPRRDRGGSGSVWPADAAARLARRRVAPRAWDHRPPAPARGLLQRFLAPVTAPLLLNEPVGS